jgi:hypothetical protein
MDVDRRKRMSNDVFDGAPEEIRTPNLLILSARPQKSGCVRYDPVPQRITAAVVHNCPVESGPIRRRLYQESGDWPAPIALELRPTY